MRTAPKQHPIAVLAEIQAFTSAPPLPKMSVGVRPAVVAGGRGSAESWGTGGKEFCRAMAGLTNMSYKCNYMTFFVTTPKAPETGSYRNCERPEN